MQFFKLLAKRTVAFSVVTGIAGLTAVATSKFHADPTVDFSFAFATSSQDDDFKLMSEEEVAAVFRDHLDVFPRSKTRALARHLLSLCHQYRFDPAFVLSMIHVESTFRVRVVSYAGAIGLMQLMPRTAAMVAKKFGIRYTGARSLTDPFTNLSLGIAYLSVLRDRYRGESPYLYVAAYNLGPTKLDSLRKQEGFRPVDTKKYYEKIRGGMHRLRYYSKERLA